jgi:replicative DNA helicase
VPTGFNDLDKILGGLQRSDMIVLAARPGVGKTSLALNIAHTAAIKYGAHVAVFSLEMS